MIEPSRELARQRALHTFEAMRHPRLYSRRHHLYGRRRWLFWRRWEALWPFATAWSAAATLGSLTGPAALGDALESFRAGLWAYARPSDRNGGDGMGLECQVTAPLGGGGERFYDDNAWIGLALMEQHRRSGEPHALSLARALLVFDLHGWVFDPGWRHPGGIRWKEPAHCLSRNTCSNAPVAQLALLVHQSSGDPAALDWGLRIYEWVRSCLLSPAGLYFDRVAEDGTISREIYSYNQGTMVGAGVLLHRITGEPRYLDHARATAAAGVDRFGPAELLGQNPAFNAVWFRNLLMLDEIDPRPSRLEAAIAYGDARWERDRNPRTGLFGSPPVLNGTGAMIELYGLIAGAPPHP